MRIQGGAELLHLIRGGIYFVALDAVTDPSLLPSRIAEAIGVDVDDSDGTFEQLARFIADKQLLLVLDNFEQLIGGAGVTADLVGRCPNLKVLVTSRERLNLAEEAVYLLEGLELPPAAGASRVGAGNEAAMRLFVNLYAAWRWIITNDRLEMGLKLATALTYTWRRSWKSWRDSEGKG